MTDEKTDEETVDPSEARDFVMARLGAARAHVSGAADDVDTLLAFFVDPDDDADGALRAEMLESLDDSLGEAARAVQAAQSAFSDIDPTEAEGDLPEDDGHDADDGVAGDG